MAIPVVVKMIPNQVINALAAYGPFYLTNYIQSAEGSTKTRFSAALVSGLALPKGLILTEDGMFTGIPAKETVGSYEVVVSAENDEGSITANFLLTIKPSLANTELGYLDKIKPQIWQALENRLPIPELADLYELPISELDIYYLFERWGIITMWDAFNLEPPAGHQTLNLEGASSHYVVYDRGSCLIAAPKDLYSHERTLEDGLQTARAMAREVYKRSWTIELTGFDKLTRAAWVEIQHLIDKYGKPLEVINFKPSVSDVKLYTNQAAEASWKGGME
jgi:hypothetical protein